MGFIKPFLVVFDLQGKWPGYRDSERAREATLSRVDWFLMVPNGLITITGKLYCYMSRQFESEGTIAAKLAADSEPLLYWEGSFEYKKRGL